MKTVTPGWLAIVGGPWDGGEYYPPRDFRAGERVRLRLPDQWKGQGYYVMTLTGRLLWVKEKR